MSDYRYQNDTNKAGEVAFRQMLAAEDKDHPYRLVHTMKERIEETIRVFKSLEQAYGLRITKDTVFGELGAERAQRMLALIDHYGLEKAYAFDISPDMLNLSKMISETFFKKSDGRGLPHEKLVLVAEDFLKVKEKIHPAQFDFVFCFATIHHFPDPRPVFQTVHSLLRDGGYFYFDREALRSWLGLHEVARFRGYFQHGSIIERKYGILETQFSLKRWREAIEIFDDWHVDLKYPVPGLYKLKMDFRSVADSRVLSFAAQLLGGRIFGLLRKKARLTDTR